MKRHYSTKLSLGLLLATATVCGCGQKELTKKDTFPAQGKLTYNGEPVRFALITLEPVERGKGEPADARTDENGDFVLRTYSNEEPDGAVPGEYKVTVEPGRGLLPGYAERKDKPSDVPQEARQPDKRVVIEASDNSVDIQLQ
jgi:hypothetical protein